MWLFIAVPVLPNLVSTLMTLPALKEARSIRCIAAPNPDPTKVSDYIQSNYLVQMNKELTSFGQRMTDHT